MANLRPVLLISLVFLGYMLWVEWQKDYAPRALPGAAERAVATETDLLPPAALPAGLDAALVEEGRQIFHQSFCIGCHGIEGTNAVGVLGPNLTALGLRGTIASGWLENSVENLEAWIRSPRSIKPGALMPGVSEGVGAFPGTGLTDPQLTAVAQYLLSLR